MTQENTVFDEAKTPEQESVQTQEAQASAFNELVGEGKKFKSEEDLAKAKVESDNFIEQLKGELSGLREDLSKRETTEELLKMLKEKQSQPSDSKEDTIPQLSKEDIAKLVEEKLVETDKSKTQTRNLSEVNSRMTEVYGEKAAQILAQRAKENGVSVDFLKDTAAHSPSAFYSLIGINKPSGSTPTTEKSSVNTAAAFQGTGPKVGTKAYFDNIRKEQGNAVYFDPKVQNQIFQAKKAGTYDE